MLVARNQPLRLDSLSSWESSGGADADRTRDLLNAIRFHAPTSSKAKQETPIEIEVTRTSSWVSLEPVAQGSRTKGGHFSDSNRLFVMPIAGECTGLWQRIFTSRRAASGMSDTPISFSANATGR